MPVYMTQFSYTSEAWAALARNPEDRSVILGELIENLGGRMVSFYYGFGEYDGMFIYEAPDESTAATAILTALSPGHVKKIKTTTLLTLEDTLEALRRAGAMTYRGPGETPDAVPPDISSPPGEERPPRPAP